MTTAWCNWSGSLRFTPGRVVEPGDEAEVAVVVREAAARGATVRVVGASHSSTPLIQTTDVLLSLDRMRGVISCDADRGEALIAAGSVINEIGPPLFDAGLAMHNTGDVDVQTLAGAIATGTHGTGRTLGNLATMFIGGTVIDGSGAVREVNIEDAPDVVRALRVSLGAIGVLTRLRVKLLPAYRLRRREWCTHIDRCMEHLPELIEDNRNFDFYWYPRSDLAKLRTMNDADAAAADYAWADVVRDQEGWSHEILARKRHLKFDEMEYVLPCDAGPACFQEVRTRVKERWRATVGWRVLYRTIAADDAYLSPMTGRDSVTISLHHNAGLPFDEYFRDIEPIFRAYDGRPHWAKKHNLTAHELASLYPEWNAYHDVRRSFDPEGTFVTPYLRTLLFEEGRS